MIEAVIFDMDGVLINSEPLWREAEIEAFEKVGITLTEAQCKETMGFRTNEVIQYWWAKTPWKTENPQLVTHDIHNIVTRLCIEKGKPMKGVHDAIELCKKQGKKLALASSSPLSLIHTVVDKFNIREKFDVIASADTEEYGKPHPGIFINTAIQLGVHPNGCLVIEDSFHGMIAAKAAKMNVLVIPDEEGQGDSRFKIADFHLKSLIELSARHFN